ncbi:MAG: hypothetical protein JO295_03615 [Verrucomicrobia bacterium]|nr:hypothetical protein [Verrucomicrobiota bacterium]
MKKPLRSLVQADRQAPDLALLPKPARDDFDFWFRHLNPLLYLTQGGICAAIERVAKDTDTPMPTVRRKFYALQRQGFRALIDKRLAGPRWWQTREQCGLSDADKELLRAYAENNQRVSRSAAKQLRTDWRTGKVKTETPVDPRTGYPRGWSLGNLCRRENLPTRFELKAARLGRSAAASERQLVYTTRRGLWVGSHIQIDDMWHDLFVNSFAEKQAGRPLELFTHDLFSARKIRWGIRVRTRKADGTWHGLEERMTRFILAATLFLDGYSPRGTMLVVEHGTAAIREAIERALHEHTGGLITVSRSGMQGAAAHAGQYPGITRGNPRHKASLESSNNLTHNVFAHLPGATGKDRQHQPEQLSALLTHNASLLAARARLSPEAAALIELPLLEVGQFHRVAGELYGQIESDSDHELEGWLECGHVAQQFFGPHGWQDIPADADPEKVAVLLSSGFVQTRPRKLSRREVWERGAGELRRIGGPLVCAILGDDLAVERRCDKGQFEFSDADLGPGEHRYTSAGQDADGFPVRFRDGETYQFLANPFAPQWAFIRDARGAYLGQVRRIEKTQRTAEEMDALHRRMGAAAHEEKEALRALGIRHAGDGERRARAARNNAAAMRSATPQPAAPLTVAEMRRRASEPDFSLPAPLKAATRTTPAPSADEPPLSGQGEPLSAVALDEPENDERDRADDAVPLW